MNVLKSWTRRQLKPTPSSNFVREIPGFQPKNLKSGVSQHPLANKRMIIIESLQDVKVSVAPGADA